MKFVVSNINDTSVVLIVDLVRYWCRLKRSLNGNNEADASPAVITDTKKPKVIEIESEGEVASVPSVEINSANVLSEGKANEPATKTPSKALPTKNLFNFFKKVDKIN